jgi:hypothetical protein
MLLDEGPEKLTLSKLRIDVQYKLKKLPACSSSFKENTIGSIEAERISNVPDEKLTQISNNLTHSHDESTPYRATDS